MLIYLTMYNYIIIYYNATIIKNLKYYWMCNELKI